MRKEQVSNKGINNTNEADDSHQEYKKVFNTERNGWIS